MDHSKESGITHLKVYFLVEILRGVDECIENFPNSTNKLEDNDFWPNLIYTYKNEIYLGHTYLGLDWFLMKQFYCTPTFFTV